MPGPAEKTNPPNPPEKPSPRRRKPALASLDGASATRANAHISALTPEEIDRIPSLPGVYLMLDARGHVIYIGKAANLRSRVRGYFTREGESRFNVRFLMRHVRTVETIVTANEKEAFLFENTLIKQEQPRYNIRLRDDKTYVSVRFNLNHEWPRAVVMRRRNEKDGALYLGPYASAGAVRQTLRLLQRVFPIRSCSDSVLNNRTRPCLLHPIGRCCAPCVKDIDREEYMRMVDATVKVLKGKTREVIAELEQKMNAHSEAMEYELAAAVRDRITQIRETAERQGVHEHDGDDRDVIVSQRAGGRVAFTVFNYRSGLLVRSRPFVFQDLERKEAELVAEFLARFYEAETPPRYVMLESEPEGRELIEEWLGERREARCELLVPQRGEKLRAIETAKENCRILLDQHLSGRKSLEDIFTEIGERFGLHTSPDPIEAFDISTIQGFATVGAMITFRRGEPDKSRYRRFRIKSFEGMDDFGALREVLTRRFRRAVEQEEMLPGLVIIDGGKGQLNVAVEVFRELGIEDVPLVGMAKARVKRRGDTTERTEERFFLPGRKNPVVFPANSPALFLLQRARDEVHRFVITYHREQRRGKNLRSRLEELPGVGKGRAKILLRHFGSLKRLREASLEEIEAVPGVPKPVASAVHLHLHSEVGEEVPGPAGLEATDAPVNAR